MTGKITSLNEQGRYGFIRPDDNSDDVFFHKNALDGVVFEYLTRGHRVMFEVEQAPKGPRAVIVSLAD